jgi:hypothetical protein
MNEIDDINMATPPASTTSIVNFVLMVVSLNDFMAIAAQRQNS